jgi:hypothetical protein
LYAVAGCASPLLPDEDPEAFMRDGGHDLARPIDGAVADHAAPRPDLASPPDLEPIGGPDPCVKLPDGTVCAPASGPCQKPGTCSGGVCSPVTNDPDGTVCAPTANPCQKPGTCTGGVCGAIATSPDGTVCDPAATPCRTDGTCKAGACGPQGTRPDGYNYNPASYVARCCGGSATTIDTNSNCGACGTSCGGGSSCIQRQGEYYCSCTLNAQCWSGCCSTFYGTPYVCAASNCAGTCIACSGGASCVNGGSTQPNYCHY